jgi:hypothetical protein
VRDGFAAVNANFDARFDQVSADAAAPRWEFDF